MIDAYEIGIQLALQDDVSAGLEVINRELAEVDRAIAATSASLDHLTQAAGGAGAAAVAGVAERPAPAEAASVVENSRSAKDPEVRESSDLAPAEATSPSAPAAAARSADGERAVVAPAAPPIAVSAAVPASGPISAPSEMPTAGSAGPQEWARVADVAKVEPLLESSAAAAAPEKQAVEEERPTEKEIVAPLSAAAPTMVERRAAPEIAAFARAPRGPAITASVARAVSPWRVEHRVAQGGPLRVAAGEAAGQGAEKTAAPWSGVEARVLAPRAATGSQQAAAPAARQPDRSDALSGNVILDGHLVGYWLAEQMAKDASRPPSGTSFFDPRQTPAWTASGSL